MKTTRTSAASLLDYLIPFLPKLLGRKNGTLVPDRAGLVWEKLEPHLKSSSGLNEALSDYLDLPEQEDARAALRMQLRKLLASNRLLDEELAHILGLHNTPDYPRSPSFQALDPSDETLKRLEILRLLRLGYNPEKLAKQFNIDTAFLYYLNASFSANSAAGIIPGANPRRWLDSLDRNDGFLRRLEMVRLARSNVPPEVVASEFGAIVEYVERLTDRFAKQGIAGLLSEEEIRKYRSFYPEVFRIASYNLHGIHDGDDVRYRPMARELSAFEPDIVAFQEAISGAGIKETSGQIAQKMSAMVGAHYRTHFALCHLYREKYPEGVATCSRYSFSNPQTIDLNENLRGDVKPVMPRFAAAFETQIFGKKVVLASTHLDHGSDSSVRAAQAEKLILELNRLYGQTDLTVVAGDFNDVEDSPAVEHFKSAGYIDAYRSCNPKGGNTFTTDNPHTRIDYIMVKGKVEIVSSRTALADPRLSDHLGVFVVARFR